MNFFERNFKRNIFSASIVLLALFFASYIFPTPVSAVTSTTTQKISGNQNTQETLFTKNLQQGDKHQDVKRLQQFLNKYGFTVSLSSDGSKGKETDTYGPKTSQAVKKFQEAYRAAILTPQKLKNGTGTFSTSTRDFINSLLKDKNKLLSVLGYKGFNISPDNQFTNLLVQSQNQLMNQTNTALNTQLNTPIISVGGVGGISSFNLGGTVSGLFGSLTLYVDKLLTTSNGQTLTLNRNGQFTFGAGIAGGSGYAVSVRNNPVSPSQDCTIVNANGTINADTSNVQVTCSTSVIPTVNISVSSAGVYEDGNTNLVFTVSLSEAVATTTTVNLSITGTATSSSDYTGYATTLVIPAGNATGTITIDPTLDTTVENNEIVKVRIKSGSGYVVGATSSSSASILNDDGAETTGTTMFIKQDGGSYLYSYDKTSWTIFTWPMNITNLSGGTLTVKFVSDMTIDNVNDYFIVNSNDVAFEGAAYNADGRPTTFTIQDVSNYNGLIQNGSQTSDGYNNVSINNIFVKSSNSNLYPGGGWIAQGYYSKNASGNTISNCGSDGTIMINSGGVVGEFSENISISKCYSTGQILNSGGGMVGWFSNNITITKSYSTGSILSNAGGLIGSSAQNSVVTKSYSMGNISSNAGGIIGADSEFVTVSNSFSFGNISSNAGGIIGHLPTSATVANSYTAGPGVGNTGGIIAGSSSDGVSNYSEANNLGSVWSDVHASSALVIGSDWVSTNTNFPYVLRGTKYSPYSISYENSYTQTIDIGDSSISATDYYNSSCTMLSINGVSPSTYPDITIVDATGVINTTSNVAAGSYAIETYCTNTDLEYSISTFDLSVVQ